MQESGIRRRSHALHAGGMRLEARCRSNRMVACLANLADTLQS